MIAVARQVTLARARAAERGWTVEDTPHVDNDRSASNGKPRPAWLRLLRELDAGQFDGVICWHTDRLYRTLRDLVALMDIAERRHLVIASVQAAELDLSTPTGRMLASMLASTARFEVEHKAERQRAANEERARQGVMGWTARRPYGYTRNGNTITVVRREAKALQRAAGRILDDGASLAQVVREMNAAGHVTTAGKAWSVTSLRRCLTNPRYAGQATYTPRKSGTSAPSRPIPVAAGAWPIILDAEIQARLTAKLGDPARLRHHGTSRKYLLSGLLTCGRCGGKCFASPTATGRMAYRCLDSRKVRCSRVQRGLADVDGYVTAVIIARLGRPDVAALLAPDTDLDSLRSAVVELRSRRDGIGRMYTDGLMSEVAAREEQEKLTARIRPIDQQIAAATGDSPLAPFAEGSDPAAVWGTLPLDRKRAVIDLLCEITIEPLGRGYRFDPASVRIEWRS